MVSYAQTGSISLVTSFGTEGGGKSLLFYAQSNVVSTVSLRGTLMNRLVTSRRAGGMAFQPDNRSLS